LSSTPKSSSEPSKASASAWIRKAPLDLDAIKKVCPEPRTILNPTPYTLNPKP